MLQQNQLPLSSASLEAEGFDVGGDAAPRNIIEEVAETILFTLDTGTLSAVAEHDPHVHLTRVGMGGAPLIIVLLRSLRLQLSWPRNGARKPLRLSRRGCASCRDIQKPAKWAAVALQQQAESIEPPSRRPQRSRSAIRRLNRRRGLLGMRQHEVSRSVRQSDNSDRLRTAQRTAQLSHNDSSRAFCGSIGPARWRWLLQAKFCGSRPACSGA